MIILQVIGSGQLEFSSNDELWNFWNCSKDSFNIFLNDCKFKVLDFTLDSNGILYDLPFWFDNYCEIYKDL